MHPKIEYLLNPEKDNKTNNIMDKPDNNNKIIKDRYKSTNKKGKITLQIDNENSKNATGNA